MFFQLCTFFLSCWIVFSSQALANDGLPLLAQDSLVLPSFNLFRYQGEDFSLLPFNFSIKLFSSPFVSKDQDILRWLRSNRSPDTGMFFSFYVLPADKPGVMAQIGPSHSVPAIIERTIVENGLVIYDGAVAQIALTLSGLTNDLRIASIPTEVYWDGELKNLNNIRAGYPDNNFIYDSLHPEDVSSNLADHGRRGFIFRIINAKGNYLSPDPLDGKTSLAGFPTWPEIHWEDWKPVAGENAWTVMAAMRIYHVKYFDSKTSKYLLHPESIELRLSEEIARAALMLQSSVGGIRMAPMGTYRENEDEHASDKGVWWYNQISTENNLSWYAAFRMLYLVTGNKIYQTAMMRQEGYFKRVYDNVHQCFYQGMSFKNGDWQVNTSDFAVDVQTWGVLSLGAQVLDRWFGDGASYRAWLKVRECATTRDKAGRLLGVGYTNETGRVSVEWTAGAIMAARKMAEFYSNSQPLWSEALWRDAREMRSGLELLRHDLPNGMTAYSYSSKRDWIPFGWNSHDPRVMSLASTGWILFADLGFNPFFIDGNYQK